MIVVIDFSKKPGGSGCYVYTQTHTNTDTQEHTQITYIESHTRNSPPHPHANIRVPTGTHTLKALWGMGKVAEYSPRWGVGQRKGR